MKDWSIVDSTTVKVRDALREEYPGIGDDAAIKGHKVLSVGCGAPVRYHFSPAREHDSRHLTIDESWRSGGLLADLAYDSLNRLRACEAHGGRFVIRLKDTWKPTVDHIARGQVAQAFFRGTALDALITAHVLSLDGRAITLLCMSAKAKRHGRCASSTSKPRKGMASSSPIFRPGSAHDRGLTSIGCAGRSHSA